MIILYYVVIIGLALSVANKITKIMYRKTNQNLENENTEEDSKYNFKL